MVVVNELERLIRSGAVTGEFQKLMSGGDPRPWFLVNPLISQRGRDLLDDHVTARPQPVAEALPPRDDHWDVFISHAHEDKAEFVEGLARELISRGLAVWYDDVVLEVGDSVRTAIDNGLARSDFGVVVISSDFMQKDWTNRELDGILAREHGEKRLLPVWHRVERRDVEEYSATVAGRFAVRSAIGVEAVADALCRSMRRGTVSGSEPPADPPPSPRFHSQVGLMANSRVYSWVVVAPAVEREAPFSDDEIESFTSWLSGIEPRAKARQAGSSYIWMNLLGDESSAIWSAEVHPGPVISLLVALELREVGSTGGHAVRFEALLGWWATVISALPTLAANLGWKRVRLGLGLNPYGSNGQKMVEVDFDEAPMPTRRANPHQIPPWSIALAPFDPFNMPTGVINPAVHDLLDRLSYGRVEATQSWVASGLGDGSLAKRYTGPAHDSNAPAGHSVSNQALESWVQKEVARHRFTEIAGARLALSAAITYSTEPLDWPWTVQGGLLRRGAYGITQAEGELSDPLITTQRQQFEASVELGRKQFRADGFDIVSQIVDRAVFLAVTNRGSLASFKAQLVGVEGVRESVPTPVNLRWRGSDGEVRQIGPDETQLVEVAEGNGMGDRKDHPGIWTFQDVSGPIPTHVGPLGSWDDLYQKDVVVTVLVRRQDTGRARLTRLQLGFANELLVSPSGDRNLELRVKEVPV